MLGLIKQYIDRKMSDNILYQQNKKIEKRLNDTNERIDRLFNKVSHIENIVSNQEYKMKHRNFEFRHFIHKLKSLSRRHQYTRGIATTIRNKVNPISDEERNRIREIIKQKRIEMELLKRRMISHETEIISCEKKICTGV